jgi:putative colanic acid biosysnthesis UDP-glucose lipid carrier transferase
MPYQVHGFLKENAPAISCLQRWLDPTIAIGLLLVLTKFQQGYISSSYITLAIVAFLLILLVFNSTGLYSSYRNSIPQVIAARLFFGWSLVVVVLLFLGYITKTSAIFSRETLLSWLLLFSITSYGVHLLIWQFLRQIRASGRNTRSAIIVGLNAVSHDLARQLSKTPELGIRISGFFDDKVPPAPRCIQGKTLIGQLKEIPDYVRENSIDIVYITGSVEEQHKIQALIGELQDTTACVYFVPNVVPNVWMPDMNAMNYRYYQINGIPIIALWEVPFSQVQYLIKRGVDIFFGIVAFALLSPIMAVIAMAIVIDSRGPIIFKQRRYGFNGQEIIVYKFRSMKVMEDGDKVTQASKDGDDRITKVGKILRRTSLDELPQFFNVIQGRMSIVGPRPHAVAHNEYYRKLINGYMLRHKVKPGITGWAQVNGLRGETDTIDKMKKRVDYDLEYLRNWSLALDFQIIFKTVFVWFRGTNAY